MIFIIFHILALFPISEICGPPWGIMDIMDIVDIVDIMDIMKIMDVMKIM